MAAASKKKTNKKAAATRAAKKQPLTDKPRCWVAGASDMLMVSYHDQEWGVPETDDRALYEKLILDGFQAGLSWRTILHKRENFRRAFDGFAPEKIARYRPARIEKLMRDAGIIRNRQKIEGAVASARAWLELQESYEGGFSAFLWRFTDGRQIQNKWKSLDQMPAKSPESEAMSKALKEAGFKFCGPTICYAFMQAVGMVNDHLVSCHRHNEVAAMAKRR